MTHYPATNPAISDAIADIAANIPNNRPHDLFPLTGFLLTVQSLSSNFCLAA